MNRLRITSSILFLIALVFSCERRLCGCDPGIESPLNGNWTLTHITYGLTQKTVTATEAGYSETLSFDGLVEAGTFKQTRNGMLLQAATYLLLFPNGGSTEGRVRYQIPNQQETLEQSFKLQENNKRLIMTERKPLTVALADGSTYTYQRK